MTILSAAVLTSLLVVPLVVFARLAKGHAGSYKNISPTEELQAILDPKGASRGDLLRSRKAPNDRLKIAFGITNPFVSDDPAVRDRFLKHTNHIIKVSQPTCHHCVPSQHGY
jgi:hypothetical protein